MSDLQHSDFLRSWGLYGLVVLFFGVLFFETVSAQEVTVVLQNGETVTGPLALLDESRVRLGEVEYSIDTLNRVDFSSNADSKDANGPQCFLIDGSRFSLQKWKVVDQNVYLMTPGGTSLSVRTRNVQAIKTRTQTPDLEARWLAMSRQNPTEGDAIMILRNGSYETLEGRINGVEDERVDFTMDERQARIKLTKLEGLVFYHASGREMVEPTFILEMKDGSQIEGRRIQVKKEWADVETVAGVKFKTKRTSLRRAVFSVGRVVFLGNVKPASTDWNPLLANSRMTSLLNQLNLPQANRGFDNQPLELFIRDDEGAIQRRRFKSGYSMKSGSKLAFSVEKKFTKAKGWVGFAPDARVGGNARIRIRGDGRSLFDKVLVNAENTGAEELELNIEGVSRIVIEVLAHDGRTVGDIFHFGDLRVVR